MVNLEPYIDMRVAESGTVKAVETVAEVAMEEVTTVK